MRNPSDVDPQSTLPFRAEPVVDQEVLSLNGDQRRLRVVPGDDSWVVRFGTPYYGRLDRLGPARAAHDALAGWGIDLPPRTYLLVAEAPGEEPIPLVVTARIHGQSLAEAAASDPEARAAAEGLVRAMLRYYANAYQGLEPYIGDIHIGQFRWGTHLHDDRPRAWFVDLDLGANAFPRDPTALDVAKLHWWIGETANSAIEVESRTGEPIAAYRSLLDQLEAGPVFAHPSAAGRVDRMRQALATGERFDANEEWLQPLFD